MNRFNKILDYVFVVFIILPWIISLIVGLTIYYGDPIVFDFFIVSTNISVLALIGYVLNPYSYEVDYYDGYIPEPDRSQEYEAIQRVIYEAEEEAATKSQHSIFDDIQEWY